MQHFVTTPLPSPLYCLSSSPLRCLSPALDPSPAFFLVSRAFADIVKLGDFGLSQHIPWYHPRSNGFVGTPYYMSPDVLNGLDYTAKADVWSLGVLMYELLTLRRPFRAENLEQLKQKVRQRKWGVLCLSWAGFWWCCRL